MTTSSPLQFSLIACRLGDIASVRYGKAKPATSGEVPVIGSGGVYAYTEEPLADENAIVVGRKGTAGRVIFPQRPSWPSDTTFFIEPDTSRVLPAFLSLYLQHANLSSDSTKTTVPSLQAQQLTELRVNLPPLEEQWRIARILSTIQNAIRRRDDDVAATRELRRAFLATLLKGGTGIDGTAESIYGRIPSHWDSRTIDEVCELTVDCPHTTPHFIDSGVLVVRNFNLQAGELVLDRAFYTSEAEYSSRTSRAVPTAGDLIFSREAPVGEAAIVPPDLRLSLGQRMMLLRVNRTVMNPAFLLAFLYTDEAQRYMQLNSTGVTAPHLNVADVRRMPIPVPPLAEQRTMADALGAIQQGIRVRRKEVLFIMLLFAS